MPTRARNRNSETALSNAIRSVLTASGCWVLRLQSGVIPLADAAGKKRFIRAGEPGCPDMIVMYPELKNSNRLCVAFCEVKTKTGRLSQSQIEWHRRAELSGIRIAVVRGVSEALAAVTAWQALNVQRRSA